MQRRRFLKGMGGMLAAITSDTAMHAVWGASIPRTDRALVVVFLRGGCDGLNLIVPYGDHDYYSARPSIAIPPPSPGAEDAVLDVDGFFGMHPALSPLREVFWEGRLAFLPAVHYPNPRHSHFESQSVLEHAGGGVGDGWLNRYLATTGGTATGLAIGPQLPDSMAGNVPVPAYAQPLNLSFSASEAFDDVLERVVSDNYIGDAGAVAPGLSDWRASAVELLADRARGSTSSNTAVRYPEGRFGAELAAAATLLRDDSAPSVITLSLGGWDTHSKQGGASGRQARTLSLLAHGLAAFQTDLGARRRDVAVLVQTEFGRTLAENASGGTDHGDASAWMILSDTLRGGIHLGALGWPGLDEASLANGRALSPTLDYRDVYGDLLQGHLDCSDSGSVIANRPRELTGLI